MDSIPRIVEEKPANELFKAATAILSLPRVYTQAITIFPGMGEMWRLEHAVKIFKASANYQYLLAAGSEWKKEVTPSQPSTELLKSNPYRLSDCDLRHVHIQEHARHTPDQAYWVVQKVKELEIKSLSLVVSPYHLPRAYRTLLKQFIKTGNGYIPIIPIPVPMSPFKIIPESNADSWTMMDGEAERIEKYQGQDFQDVATLPELKTYLDWLWKHPLIQN